MFVYDFYLWGPALHVDTKADEVVVETAPVTEVRSCPPNRFPPVLLLVIAPGRTIEGDYTDSELEITGEEARLTSVAVGTKPYSVVAEAKRFYNSRCEHNPYDAIVRWGTILWKVPPFSCPIRIRDDGQKGYRHGGGLCCVYALPASPLRRLWQP